MGANANDTPLNVLISFAYLGKNERFKELAFASHRNGEINLMIDSGAFTAYNAKGNFDFITLDNYCDFLKKHKNECDKYVMLDVLRNERASKANYEEMLRRGLNPMFVLTMYDNDMDYFRHAVDVNPDCCIAGGSVTKGLWIQKRFQTAYKASGGKAQIHGLAYVTYPNMLRLPLASVDSSSWKAGALRFGSFSYFDNGMKTTDITSIRKNRKVPAKLAYIFEKCNINVPQLLNSFNHRGTNIQNMVSTISYLDYQKFCYKRGLRLFLAISDYKDLLKILYIKNHAHNLNFSEFRNLK